MAAGSSIGAWEHSSVDNDLQYVQVETNEPDDPLVVQTRRGPLHVRTALSLIDIHVRKCQVEHGPGVVLPDSLHPVELVVNGAPTPGYLLDGGTVAEVVLRVGQLTVAVVATATWVRRHGGWPHLVTAQGDTDELQRVLITGQPR